MTENEAIDKLNNLHYKIVHTSFCNKVYESEIEALCMAKDCLKEIQQYRAIGTVKEIKIREAQFARLSEGYLNDLTSLREYQAIGTIEEFKTLKEKSVTRKIKGTRFAEAICPKCESELFETYWAFGGVHYCSNCGQAIDWSEG